MTTTDLFVEGEMHPYSQAAHGYSDGDVHRFYSRTYSCQSTIACVKVSTRVEAPTVRFVLMVPTLISLLPPSCTPNLTSTYSYNKLRLW